MATSWHLRDSTKRRETKAHLWRGVSLLIDSRALEDIVLQSDDPGGFERHLAGHLGADLL